MNSSHFSPCYFLHLRKICARIDPAVIKPFQKIYTVEELIELANDYLTVGPRLDRPDIDAKGQLLWKCIYDIVFDLGGYVINGATVWCRETPERGGILGRGEILSMGPVSRCDWDDHYKERLQGQDPNSPVAKLVYRLMEEEWAEELAEELEISRIPIARDVRVVWEDPFPALDPCS